MNGNWNRCVVIWKGKTCSNLTRYPGGTKCNTCSNRTTRARSPGAVKKYNQDYYQNNLEHCRKRSRDRYATHRQDELDRHFIYRVENSKKISEYNKNVRNPKRKAERQAKRALCAQAAAQADTSGTIGQSEQSKDTSGH